MPHWQDIKACWACHNHYTILYNLSDAIQKPSVIVEFVIFKCHGTPSQQHNIILQVCLDGERRNAGWLGRLAAKDKSFSGSHELLSRGCSLSGCTGGLGRHQTGSSSTSWRYHCLYPIHHAQRPNQTPRAGAKEPDWKTDPESGGRQPQIESLTRAAWFPSGWVTSLTLSAVSPHSPRGACLVWVGEGWWSHANWRYPQRVIIALTEVEQRGLQPRRRLEEEVNI